LRTNEFLWQEGHTAHATAEEAQEETLKMLGVYRRFAEEFMAVPVVAGQKTENEKFAGADRTYCIEAMTQDNRAIQAGTSHNLGQNFARAFDVTYQTADGKLDYVYATSWGVSTRLVGALVMAHSDDQGLVLPPKLAPVQVVIVPIWKSDSEKAAVMECVGKMHEMLDGALAVEVDDREQFSPGWKFNEWELKGVPLRLEIGPRDVEKGEAVFARRDTGEKSAVPLRAVGDETAKRLDGIQRDLHDRALRRREDNTHVVDSYDRFREIVVDGDGGFIEAHWCGSGNCEQAIQGETQATIRCIPLDQESERGTCLYCGKPSDGRVVMAKAY